MAEGPFERIKKHQITGFELRPVNILRCCCLLFGAARQHQANALLVHGANKTTAVKARFSRIAAAFVRYAQKPHGIKYKLGSLVTHVLPNLIDLAEQSFVSQ